MVGFLFDDVEVEYVGYGMVFGFDGCFFKICEGGIVLLLDLFDEVEMYVVLNIVLVVIKYVDLFNGLQKDYVFDVEWMVQIIGDIGLYLQYVYVCVLQILCKVVVEVNLNVDFEVDLDVMDWGCISVFDELVE